MRQSPNLIYSPSAQQSPSNHSTTLCGRIEFALTQRQHQGSGLGEELGMLGLSQPSGWYGYGIRAPRIELLAGRGHARVYPQIGVLTLGLYCRVVRGSH